MCIAEMLSVSKSSSGEDQPGFYHWMGVKGWVNYVGYTGFIDMQKDHFKFCALLFIHSLKFKYISCVFLEQQGKVGRFPFWHDWKGKSVFAYLETQKNLCCQIQWNVEDHFWPLVRTKNSCSHLLTNTDNNKHKLTVSWWNWLKNQLLHMSLYHFCLKPTLATETVSYVKC